MTDETIFFGWGIYVFVIKSRKNGFDLNFTYSNPRY